MKLSEADAPVSIEAHYQVLRFVENSVIAELQKSDHAWLPVGARVSYSVIDEDDNMVGAPFELECGYTRPLDEAPIVEVDDAALYEIVDAPSDSDPLSIEFVDELRAAAQSQLQASAEQRLAVSISGVLTGSLSLYGSGCYCSGSRIGYYRNGTLYCRTTRCY